MLVIAVSLALEIGLPVDLVSLYLSLVQTFIALKGEMSMVNFEYMVVSGAHGVAKCICG